MVVWLVASVITDNIVCLSLLLYLVRRSTLFNVWARLMTDGYYSASEGGHSLLPCFGL